MIPQLSMIMITTATIMLMTMTSVARINKKKEELEDAVDDGDL